MATALRISEYENQLGWREQREPEYLPTGLADVDRAFGGLPRGCVTEVYGAASCGRTTLFSAALAQATARGETCVLVDAADAFDPQGAASAGVDLARLLWVRCHGAEEALKAADLLLHAGGFGLVIMDLADTPVQTARRISLTSWFRLRRAVEDTPTALLVIEPHPFAKTCAALTLELEREKSSWSGVPGCSRLLRGLRIKAERRKPALWCAAAFEARAGG